MTQPPAPGGADARPPDPVLLTRAGYDRLLAELRTLREVRRPALLEQARRIAWFVDAERTAPFLNATHGDLAIVEAEIARLDAALASARAIDEPTGATIQPGASFTVQDEDGAEETLRLVGPAEADPTRGAISDASPAGRVLVGKGAGARVTLGDGHRSLTAHRR